MSTLYDPELTQWLQLSGEYIGHVRPDNERVGWMMFLFEQIEPFMEPAEFQAFLNDVQQALEARRSQAAAG